jgi:deazaflavin-dependent oxidoreductase (nitroreductase family)
VITTTGRRTGKRHRRCIRAIREGDKVYAVAIKGAAVTGWIKNALAGPEVKLRIRGGSFEGRARELEDSEREAARRTYCGTVNRFDFMECAMWVKGRPTEEKIRELHRGWFERGTPIVIELSPR